MDGLLAIAPVCETDKNLPFGNSGSQALKVFSVLFVFRIKYTWKPYNKKGIKKQNSNQRNIKSKLKKLSVFALPNIL